MKKSAIEQTGIALVIVMAFIFLIAVLAVGIMETIRIENVSANSHLEGLQAEFYAQAAVDRVVGALQMQTAPQQTGTNMVFNWISQPGQLIVSSSATSGQLSGTVALSSGTADTALSTEPRTYLRPPNLNISMFRDPAAYLITEHTDASGNATQMSASWIYIRQNGSLDSASVPNLTNKTNPIVGRYAYWTDDESSKINFNLAWGRTGNTNPEGDPSQIDLTALQPLADNTDTKRVPFTQPWANALHSYITPPRFYNSPEDVRVMSGTNQSLANALENYKFETTHYNTDPDRTFFNEPRIVLTTQLKYAPITTSGTAPFLDILVTPNSDPGQVSNLDTDKLNATISLLIKYLQRKDWPMANGASFQDKYYKNNPTRLTQLAINIIDYVRGKESTVDVIEPIRGEELNSKFNLSSASGSNAFLGITRAPCITQLGVMMSGTKTSLSGSTGYLMTLKMEVCLPENYGLRSLDLTKYKVYFESDGVSVASEVLIAGSEITSSNPPYVGAGEYAVITRVLNEKVGLLYALPTRPATLGIRVALSEDSGAHVVRLNVCPLGVNPVGSSNGYIQVPIDSPSVPLNNITSTEIDDPRVNQHYADWNTNVSGVNTFGKKLRQKTFCSIGKAPASAVSPQQDTDPEGLISDASFYMPPPKGKQFTRSDGTVDDNTNGVVTSVGELGYIHTGMESFTAAGTPWRTIRLQPNKLSAAIVPDWALMDLFTVPLTVSDSVKHIVQPDGISYGGRVNINSHVEPYNDIKRVLPLAAVVQGCQYDSTNTATILSSGSAQTIAQNLYDRVVASDPTNGNNGKLYNFTNGYYSPGEIVEIMGVADGGEKSEALVRQVSNLITARGNVFSVYSVGQSIKQTPAGGLVVTGERRLRSMVERYVDSATGGIRFRTIYYRNLTP
jgi:hypothetical protein